MVNISSMYSDCIQSEIIDRYFSCHFIYIKIDLLQVLLSTELCIIPCYVNCPPCVFEYRFSDMFALTSIYRSTHDNALPKINAVIFYSCYMLRADKSSVWCICIYRLTSYKKYTNDISRINIEYQIPASDYCTATFIYKFVLCSMSIPFVNCYSNIYIWITIAFIISHAIITRFNFAFLFAIFGFLDPI